jgi:hypothetical protein
MQKFSYEPRASERPLLRRWRLAVIGFYGSLLALIAILAVATSNSDVQIARTDQILVPQK